MARGDAYPWWCVVQFAIRSIGVHTYVQVLRAHGKISGRQGGTRIVGPDFYSKLLYTHLYLAVFAQQGYVTIAMNPTGSTTFGQGGSKKLILARESTQPPIQISRMPFRRTGEADPSKTCKRVGSMSSKHTLRYRCLPAS